MVEYPILTIYNGLQTVNINQLDSNPLEYNNAFLQNILLANRVLPKKYNFTIASNNEPYKNLDLINFFIEKHRI